MTGTSQDPRRLARIPTFTVAIGLCFTIRVQALGLPTAELSLPLSYSGDSLWTYTMAKTIEDTGWYLDNSMLGAPGGNQIYGFPQSINLDFLIIKSLIALTSNSVLATNLYFLLTFPLTTVTTLLLLSGLKFSYHVAVPVSILYTFLPYHFLRGISHLFLSAYYLLPLAIMGGFGTVLGFFFPYILCYNRISVFIALFSLIMLAELLQLIYDQLTATTGRKAFFCVAIGVLLIVGVADQTSPEFVPPYDQIQSAYATDDHFVRQIKAIMPANATIYQMPYMQFPEGRNINSLENYQLFRG